MYSNFRFRHFWSLTVGHPEQSGLSKQPTYLLTDFWLNNDIVFAFLSFSITICFARKKMKKVWSRINARLIDGTEALQSGRMISQVWNLNKKDIIDPIQNFILLEERTIFAVLFCFIITLFKDYINLILALISYTLMKSHLNVLQTHFVISQV